MKFKKNGNLAKLVAFFLIAIVLITAIAVSASGWNENIDPKPDSDNNADNESGNADENTGDSNEEDTPTIKPTNYTHYVTGLSINEADYMERPISLVFDPTAPMYGISSAFLTIELPIEGDKTRILAFTNEAISLGKLGSFAPTRKYISNFAAYFGGLLASNGSDDSFSYTGTQEIDEYIDFQRTPGYCYSEYGKYYYTNADLMQAYIKNNSLSAVKREECVIPYSFSDSIVKGSRSASVIVSPYSGYITTELTYSAESEKYYMSRNTFATSDMHTGTQLSYDNIFILCADSVTHETESATQLVMDTSSGGRGYYASKGYYTEFEWSTDSDGNLCFTDLEGNRLAINPGSIYISVIKSSYTNKISIN